MENYNEQKARDYDKEPIVVKKMDDLFWLIALGILLICSLTYHFSSEYKFRFYMKILLGYGIAFFFIYAASFMRKRDSSKQHLRLQICLYNSEFCAI